MKRLADICTSCKVHLRIFLDYLIDHPVQAFLCLSMAFGILFIFRLAPLNGTDEFTHFPRVYQITEGVFWAQKFSNEQYGGYLPYNINSMVNDYRDLSRKPEGQVYTSRKQQLQHIYSSTNKVGTSYSQAIYTSVVIYPPWAYAPSIIGIIIAKVLAVPLIWYVYLARLATLFVWIGLTSVAITILPRGKWFLVAVALLPTSLTQASTIGADGLVNGLSWLIIAYTLAVLARKIRLGWPNLILLSLASILLSITKDGYWLIAAFPLILPLEFFAHKLQAWIWRATDLILLVTVAVLFALRTSHVSSTTVLTPQLGLYINSKAQLSFLLHHLPSFVGGVLLQPFTKSYDTVYEGVVGIITNRLIYLSILLMGLLYLALFISFYSSERVPQLVQFKKRLWAVAILIIGGTYFLLSVAFYLGNTQVGSSTVFGVYGRYFLPLLPILLVFPLTRAKKSYLGQRAVVGCVVSILIFGLISAIMSLA